MSLGGTLDFQGQSAQSLRFLESIAVNTNLAQNANIDTLLAPMDQGIVLFWLASGAYLGNPITVFSQGSAAGALFSNESRIQSGRFISVPMLGQVAVSALVTPITLVIQRPADQIGPALGTLLVFAQTAPVDVNAVKRWDDLGHGFPNPTTNAAATTTATILAPPAAGTYYRIKSVSWWTLTAPAANQRVTWNDNAGGVIAGTMGGPTFPLQSQVFLDIENGTGVTITNNLSVTITAVVAAELWPKN